MLNSLSKIQQITLLIIVIFITIMIPHVVQDYVHGNIRVDDIWLVGLIIAIGLFIWNIAYRKKSK